jgi:diadenylate cyclase
VDPLSRIFDVLDRLRSYSGLQVAIELAVIWVVVFLVFKFVQGTRAAGALKGTIVVVILMTLLARILGGGDAFLRLSFLYDRFLGVIALTLIVVFQPELRRALVRIGETPFFRSTPSDIAEVADAVTDACAYLSKAKFGAIIAIERQTGLQALSEGGVYLGAEVSSRLLQTIFFPGSALHDLAVIIKGKIVHSAGVQLPLAESADMPDPRLGSRHRAAVGLTKESDALVVVVSEESGSISIAERGLLTRDLSPDRLRAELRIRLQRARPPKGLPAAAETEASGHA